MNPENIDKNKLSSFNFAVIDGNVIKEGTLRNVVAKVVPMMSKNSLVLIVNKKENKITEE